jgi:AcrR family transcriptional regulator
MPKAWNDREKQLVKAALLMEGRTIFEKYGVQKTTVDEIVKAAKISKGSFYLFYDSKEALFLDILDAVQLEFREKLFSNVYNPGVSKRESFKSFLYQLTELVITMPLYKQINSLVYEYLYRKVPKEVFNKHLKEDQEDTTKFFIYWIDQGWMRKVDIKALNGILSALVSFVLRRQELDVENFKAIKELWINMLSDYLILE